MKRHLRDFHCDDRFEYHGNTAIERVRRRAGRLVSREWLMFDSVDDAMEFFNNHCGEPPVGVPPAWMIQQDATG